MAAKKKTSPKKAKAAAKPTGGLQGFGAMLDDLGHRLMNMAMTYTMVLVAGAVILLFLMLFAGGYFFNFGDRVHNGSVMLAKAAGFQIERVTLKGAHYTNAKEVVAMLHDAKTGPATGKSLLHYDLTKAKKNVEKLGWVESVAVTRLWPNTLHVSVAERTPAAVWQTDERGTLYLVDKIGKVITRVGGDEFAALPMIVGAPSTQKAEHIVQSLSKYPSLMDHLAALKFMGERRWDIVFENGFTVKLPEENPELAIARIARLYAANSDMIHKLEYLDLRDAKTATLLPKLERELGE